MLGFGSIMLDDYRRKESMMDSQKATVDVELHGSKRAAAVEADEIDSAFTRTRCWLMLGLGEWRVVVDRMKECRKKKKVRGGADQ